VRRVVTIVARPVPPDALRRHYRHHRHVVTSSRPHPSRSSRRHVVTASSVTTF